MKQFVPKSDYTTSRTGRHFSSFEVIIGDIILVSVFPYSRSLPIYYDQHTTV